MLCLTLPNGTPGEVHQVLKMGGDVVRPDVADVPTLAEMLPLGRVRYVDVNTSVPVADRTGTIARPFGTIQAGIDALPAPGGVIILAPGAYTEPAMTVPATKAISFIGCAPNGFGAAGNVTVTNSLSSSADIGVFGVTFNNAVITSQRGKVTESAITNLTATAGVQLEDSTISNLSATGGASTLKDSTILNNCSLQAVDMQGCQFTGGIPVLCSGALAARFCSFTPQLVASSTANLWKCRATSIACSGAMTTDLDSISNALASLTFTTCTVNGPSAAKITLSVVVPAVANDAVGYVDVSLVGTDLEGIVPAGSLLLANPTADLVAAGAGGGFINVRASAANTARFAFLGPLAGGASNFLLGVL